MSMLVGMAFALASLAADAPAVDKKPMVVVPFEDAKFVPLDPTRPEGPELAVLWGDPDKGPSAIFLKLRKSEGRLHYHTSDYHLVLLQGSMKHWAETEREADAKSLGPGSYWFQPGNQVHGDTCLTEECLLFVQWADRRDAKLPEPPRK